MTQLLFLLGGRDLEMLEIGRLIRDTLGPEAVLDRCLPWHAAKASAYQEEILLAFEAGRMPVLVELEPDLPPGVLAGCRIVDHHGERAGATRPTSLEQVFQLLDLPPEKWSRRLALVAANDRGWIPELRAAGASDSEVASIRAEDRAAQGETAAEAAAAEAAMSQAQTRLDGSLLLVRLPHDRSGAVFDGLALSAGTSEPPDALVVGPEEVNFSGRGGRVCALVAAFPGGWSGGALPDRGFWGHARPLPSLSAVLEVLAET